MYPCIHVSMYLCIYVSMYLYIYIPTYLRTYIPAYLPTYIPTCLHTYVPKYLPTYLHTYLHTYFLDQHPISQLHMQKSPISIARWAPPVPVSHCGPADHLMASETLSLSVTVWGRIKNVSHCSDPKRLRCAACHVNLLRLEAVIEVEVLLLTSWWTMRELQSTSIIKYLQVL